MGLARKGLGRTSPNPAVGAVVVRKGRIISSGYHKKAGGPHAEVEALAGMAGRAGKDDILYVTLEPCNHRGRTPPCTAAILKKGFKRVVVGMKDPNPHVYGGGCESLAEMGVEVRTGILEAECRRLNEDFIKFVTTGRPFVVAKSAMTLDGWTATGTGHSQWISNEQSRQFVHRLRNRVQAVMVGIGTVMADDPQLTTRLKKGKGRDPLRIVLDTRLRIPEGAKVLNSDSPSETLLVVGDDVPAERLLRVRKEGVSTLVCPREKGMIDLARLLDLLGDMAVTSLMVEGGARLMGSLIRARLIDKFYVFKAPKLLGGGDGIPMASGRGPERMDRCLVLKDLRVRRFGDDILIRGYPSCLPD